MSIVNEMAPGTVSYHGWCKRLVGQHDKFGQLFTQLIPFRSVSLGSLLRGLSLARRQQEAGVEPDFLNRRSTIRETRWKGAKAREIGEGVKLFYGEDTKRNGVATAVAESLKDCLRRQ
ncbi:unnamed protein product [Haemonchus placei]|uniref:HTH_48 domain-containing protein n=1 Tax=Haemonchus placei TaxID=6290 RepID=A0A0N4WJU2_HAEPC|nr:unnamed protein product [Haemonchus placei]